MTNSFLKLATEGNKAAILKQQIICQYILGGDSSITDLSKAVNLSVPTVTKLIGELIDEGFVHNFGEQGTAGGRRPNIYGLNPYAGYFVGVDLRKDSVMMAAINFKGQLIDETTVDFLMDNDPRSLDRLCDVIQNFIRARRGTVVKGQVDGVFITTTGIGRIMDNANTSGKLAKAGDAVIVSGDIGRHGCTILLARDEFGIEADVTSDCAPLWANVKAMFDVTNDIHVIRDATRGGVGTVLYEIAGQSGVGITLDAEKIWVADEVKGVCGMLGLEPLYLA